MSAFDLDLNSENSLSDSNIQTFTSPKLSEKDLSAIYANSGDRSFKMSSPTPMSGEYKLNCLASCDRLSSLNDSSILQDSNTSSVQEEEETPSTSEETAQQRMEREERESQELAWQLMQEENMEVYNMQMQFMRENADQMSEEDLALIQAMINESAQPQQGAPAAAGTIGASEEEGEAEEGDELNESDSSNWDYERLLQLGQQIGDVKTERWRMRAKGVINSLPRQLYSELMPPLSAAAATTKPVTVFTAAIASSPAAEPTERDERSSSNKKQCVRAAACGCDTTSGTNSATTMEVQTERCVVCMDDFEAHEELVVFPCKHYFHIPCTEGWLADHNFCPSCKTKVSATPEK